MFYETLDNNDGAIIGSIALKAIIPRCGNDWPPQDLNIVVPSGQLLSMLSFFLHHEFELTDTGVDIQCAISDIHSFLVYECGRSRITISESAHNDLFISIILASLHTDAMNFVTANVICCLYPTIMPSMQSCSFWNSRGLTDNQCQQMMSCGFDLLTSSSQLSKSCKDLCPLTVRQLWGLRWIGLFHWRGSGVCNIGEMSYSWNIGEYCTNLGCPTQAFAALARRFT